MKHKFNLISDLVCCTSISFKPDTSISNKGKDLRQREDRGTPEERVSVSLFKGGADGSMSGNIQKGEVWLSEGGEEGRW